MLRLGKCLEVFYAAYKSIHYENVTIKLTSTLSKISNALYLICDHLLWIGRSGLASVNTSKWSQISNKYWLYSILMNLVRDIYEVTKVIEKESFRLKFSGKTIPLKNNIKKQIILFASIFINDHKDVLWDFIKNGCDVWIPMTALGYTKFKPGTIGFLGTISSIAGLISIINPRAKLVP